jgi:hypothetical protein
MKDAQYNKGITSKAIQKVIKTYYTSLQKVSEIVNDIESEYDFYSSGMVEDKISQLVHKQNNIENQLGFYMEKQKLGNLTKNENIEIKELEDELNTIIENIVFYKSHKEEEIDTSIEFLKKISYSGPLSDCLAGLKCYFKNDISSTKEYLRKYFSENPQAFHFPAIKIYARICHNEANWHQAKRFAMKGIYLKPEDLEFHQIMFDAHCALNEEQGKQIEAQIISILN